MNYLNKSSLVLLAAAVLICLGLIIYFASLSNPGSDFSEFYILNEDGRPFGSPVKATAGQPVYVTIGIVNREAKPTSYTVRVMSGGVIIKSLDTGVVDRGQNWEGKTDIVSGTAGTGRQVEFYLYIAGEQGPHIGQPLVLTMDVKRP